MAGRREPVLKSGPELVRAMPQYRMGEVLDYSRTLDRAIRSFDWGAAYTRIGEVWMLHSLRREAEALINPGPGRVP